MSPDGVDEILDKHLVGKCKIEEVRTLARIANKCLYKTPKKRPAIGEVLQAISRVRKRRLTKEDTMSSFASDFSRAVSHIECQQVELTRMISAKE